VPRALWGFSRGLRLGEVGSKRHRTVEAERVFSANRLGPCGSGQRSNFPPNYPPEFGDNRDIRRRPGIVLYLPRY
jgi:hypothetical protein